MADVQDLETLINSRYPILYLETHEERRAEDLLKGIAHHLGLALFTWTATEGLRRQGQDKAVYQTKAPLEALGFIGTSDLPALYLLKDFHRYLEQPEVVRKLRDICGAYRKARRAILICSPVVLIPPEIEKETVLFTLKLPTREELRALLREVETDPVVVRGATVLLNPAEEERVVQALAGLTRAEGRRAILEALADDWCLSIEDLPRLLNVKRRALGKDGVLEYYEGGETLNDVGGMERLKAWLAKRREAFTPEAKAFGLDPPKGLLLVGVQGCGKSLCCKAVARSWGLPLLQLDPGRLYDKYIGETERRLRQALQQAEAVAPVVLWVDELEKGFVAVGSAETDAGVSARVLGSFLGWLQDRRAAVFVVATSNNIQALPPELLRKGRFDEIFFVDLPRQAEREAILAIHLKKRGRDPARFELAALAGAGRGFSGAELEQAIVAALYSAFAGKRELTTELILEEMRQTVPLSTTMREEVEALRAWAKGRTVMAGAESGTP